MILVALELSYLNITYHTAYKTLSHVYLFLHFGSSKIGICGFNNQMHLHLSSFVWNAAQTTSCSGLSDRRAFTPGLLAIRSEKTHEVTRCKRPLTDEMRMTIACKISCSPTSMDLYVSSMQLFTSQDIN